MNEITTRHSFRCDLNAGTLEVTLDAPLMHQDALGDVFSVSVWRSGSPVELDGVTVRGYLYLAATQQTILLDGSASGSSAAVTLDSSCYAVPGHASLVIQLQKGTVRHTVLKANFVIDRTCTDTVIDPSSVLPTLPELLAQIAAMEQGTAAANAAAEAANTAAANAKEFIVTVTTPAYILDGDMSGIKADKTYAEIQAAINAGKTPVVKLKTSGQAQTKILHLAMTAPYSIVFREHTQEPSTYNTAGSARCTFLSTGGIVWDAVEFHTVPDSGAEGQVLVKTGDSTYGWRDPEKTAPPIIPTATGEIVSVSDSEKRPLAGLRLYGKTTQDSTPTPDAPVPLVNVGADGSIGVKASGKNLLSRSDLIDGMQVSNPGDAAAIVDGYGWRKEVAVGVSGIEIGRTYKLPCLRPGVTYTLSFVAWSSGTGACYVDCYPDTLPETRITLSATPTRLTWTFSSDHADMAGARIRVFGENTGSDTWIVRVVDIKLEVGSIATPFEPYKDGGSVTVSTPNGLPGLPVSSGGNYVDTTGQMWLCDEKDYERGEYVENMLTITLNGSNYPFIASSNNAFSAELPLGYDAAYGDYRAISSHLTFDGYIINANAMGRDDAFAIYRHPDAVVGACSVFIRMTRFTTADELNTWLASNPVTIMYPRRKPIVTPLSADELTAYRAMTSQYPNTTVYNDAGAGMAVDYIADTQRYIDGKLASISEALLNK